MSGSKSGGISLSPILILAGAPIALAVVGTVYVAGAAVQAYFDARDRIRRAREQAMKEQREDVNRLMDSWRGKLAAAEHAMPLPQIRTIEESLAGMAAAGPVIVSGNAADELTGYISGQEIIVPAPFDDQWRQAEQKRCQDVIDIMKEIISSMTVPLSDSIAAQIRDLNQISDAQELAGRSLQVRLEINKEVQRIEEKRDNDKTTASKMLEDLPEDCPPDARKSFQEAADGSSPLTDELQQLYANLKQTQKQREQEQKEVDMKNKELASKVLQSALEEMGYEVGAVNSNLFANGNEAYIRNDQWDEGYCVNLRIVKDRVHFKAVKEGDSDREHDASMERAWKSEFDHVTDRLNEAGIKIKDIIVGSEPGDMEVHKKIKMPINTKKKRTATPEGTAGTSTPTGATATPAGATATTATANQYASRGRTP